MSNLELKVEQMCDMRTKEENNKRKLFFDKMF